jgi:hypothetical protein
MSRATLLSCPSLTSSKDYPFWCPGSVRHPDAPGRSWGDQGDCWTAVLIFDVNMERTRAACGVGADAPILFDRCAAHACVAPRPIR